MLVAHGLRVGDFVVIAKNILGQVVLVNPAVLGSIGPVLVPDATLDTLGEEDALSLMIREGRNEDVILEYIKGRRAREAGATTE